MEPSTKPLCHDWKQSMAANKMSSNLQTVNNEMPGDALGFENVTYKIPTSLWARSGSYYPSATSAMHSNVGKKQQSNSAASKILRFPSNTPKKSSTIHYCKLC